MTHTFTEALACIRSSIEMGDHTPTLLLGQPGTGKTSLFLKISDDFGVPRHLAESVIFRPSLRDPVDLMGVPFIDEQEEGKVTRWALNELIINGNRIAETYGGCMFVLDELAQAPVMMQNACAGLMHDRYIGDNVLDDRVFVGATGNRAEDKAGSGRILTQLGNRLEVLELEVDLPAWSQYMIEMGYDPLLVAYINYRPDALQDFVPSRITNPTMRSWEMAAKVSTSLPASVYRAKISGRVGEGRAAEYIAFRQVYDELPDIQSILSAPMTALIPPDQGARYASVALLVKNISQVNWPALCQYIGRFATDVMSPEMEVAFFKDVSVRLPEYVQTREFGAWASGRGQEVLL